MQGCFHGGVRVIRVGGLKGQEEDGLDCDCGLKRGPAATFQSLDELEFHRSAGHAASTGDLEKLRRIIKTNPSAAHGGGGTGYTPLLYAARAGHEHICLFLLDCGAEIDAKTRGGATALHRAASGGHMDVIQLLISKGSDGLTEDSDRETPAHKAAAAGHTSIVQFLIQTFPSSASLVNRHGKTPAQILTNSTFATDWGQSGPKLLGLGGDAAALV